jgi:hypothetical protein
MPTYFRAALDPSLFLKTTSGVCVPPNLKELVVRALKLSGEFDDLADLCDDLSLECPCTRFLSLHEADSLSTKERRAAVPVCRQRNVAIPIESWSPEQIVVKLLSALGDDEGDEKSCVCNVQFDNGCDSFTVDRLDDAESPVVIFSDYEDVDGTTELRLSLISALAAVSRRKDQTQAVHPFVRIDCAVDSAQPMKKSKQEGAQSYVLPFWYGHLMSLWLSNVLRAHVLCNASLPAGFERPFSLDSVYFIAPTNNSDCIISMFLHHSTSACICRGNAPAGAARPVFRLSFCGTCFDGECYKHGSRSRRASCASANAAPSRRVCLCGLNVRAICRHDGDSESFKRSVSLCTQPDGFLSAACAVGLGLASDQGSQTTEQLRTFLLDAYKDVLQSGDRMVADEAQLKQTDMIVETMIRSNLYTKRLKRGSSEYQLVRKDGVAVRTHERAVLSTHSHLLG